MRVLYWGHQAYGPVPYFRGGQFMPYWAEHGVEARYLDYQAERVDLAEFQWADVIVFRRWYDDDVTENAWNVAGHFGKRLYDTDDWDLGTPTKIPQHQHIERAMPLIKRMVREADIVTTATPALAVRYRALARTEPMVLRNAVDMPLYAPTEPRTNERLTSLFYGTHARLRDYFGAFDERGRWRGGYPHSAVQAAGLRAVWVGDEGVGPIPVEFQQIIPYAKDLAAFFRTLGNVHADIGVAPLMDDAFNFCKSELHWLELTAAGVAVVAQRLMGGGPYSVIRDGVDGLLVKGHAEWIDAVRTLTREPTMRADMVAAARERIAMTYNPLVRAGEWAQAFAAAR